MFAELYGELAASFAEEGDGPFWPAWLVSQGKPKFDDGGSLVPSPVGPWQRECVVQIDAADTAMRGEKGFAETDRRIIIPIGTLSGPVTTDHQVEVRSGPFAGVWNIESVRSNAAASQLVARGRKG